MKTIKKNKKRYIAFLAVLIILVSITVTPAHAISNSSKQRFGAWLASALLAMNITLNSVAAPYQDMLDYIPDQLGIYTPTWDNDYLDRSTIQIWDDYVEIDGVNYTDIWLSTEAAEKFRTDGFDFKTAYNLVSNSNGTFASGEGFVDGSPVFYVSGEGYQTQWYRTPNILGDSYSIGNGTVSSNYYSSSSNKLQYDSSNSLTYNHNFTKNANTRTRIRNNSVTPPSWPTTWNVQMTDGGSVYSSNNLQIPSNHTPFDFDWVSETIPADTPLPDGTGMMIRVPTDDIQNWINDNPDLVGNPIDINVTLDPNITAKIDDLIDLIIPVLPYLDFGDITFVENHITPSPDIPIIDATVPQVINPIINEITNYGDTITQQIPNIIETIPTIDDICNNIDTAPYHDLDTGLDHLPTVFLPFITDLRSALGIWHYVTEWLSQISSTFSFITGCLVGTTIMTPIYAAIAGFICIKIYRRMTG